MSGVLSYNTIIVLLGSALLGASAGVIGCFAVLRRRALVGDAMAHAALPGLALAFLVFGERRFELLLLGAAVTGLAGIAILALLRRWTRLKEDAAIGLVLGTFSGAGAVLFTIIQQVPRGAAAGLESFIFGKTAGMVASDVYVLGGLAGVTLFVVLLLYKELELVTFDAEFARVQGWPCGALDFLLMLLIVVAVVIGLPSVGALLIAALLVIPAAAARFWTERFGVMLLLAGGSGLVAGLLGTLASASLDRVPAGPAIVVVCTGLFLLSLLLAPRRGLLARWIAYRRDRLALLQQLRAGREIP
jgi:manganese/zinc/iron transport system permease protein